MKAKIKVYITKYALVEGAGIQEVEVSECEDSPKMVRVVNPDRVFGCYYHGEGREWHRTMEAAVARAELMRLNKVQALKKTIARLEGLKFS